MKPEKNSDTILRITRSKAKMWEYNVPPELHIDLPVNPDRLFMLTISMLGDYAALISNFNLEKEQIINKDLRFSAYYFDSYFQTQLEPNLNTYTLLLGATTYYLCDIPGSSEVLIKNIKDLDYNLECDYLDHFLHWLLNFDINFDIVELHGKYSSIIERLYNLITDYYSTGNHFDKILVELKLLRATSYNSGTPRELLFSDLVGAMIIKRIYNSSLFSIPKYTDIDSAEWNSIHNGKNFIREFWPSQHIIGQNDTFKGKSSIIQMPTSAGKTKAIEIIIKSSFLSQRSQFVIIVAPFRALCQEISLNLAEIFDDTIKINEISDIYEFDNEQFDSEDQNIIIVTPEKLVYLLRQSTNFIKKTGLIIYDEGHQIGNDSRGIVYELLLTTLKRVTNEDTQIVMLSAVLSNAKSIGDWLVHGDVSVMMNKNLNPTYRTIALVHWTGTFNNLIFVNQSDPRYEQFFVPKIMDQQSLLLFGRERKPRLFPDKINSQSIAIYLCYKLIKTGSVAIFCGTKRQVKSVCNSIIENHHRGFNNLLPLNISDKNETKLIASLYENNLGTEAPYTICANLGIFSHQGNIPHGIRQCVEYAVRNRLVRFIICTSTLAQGVNLPIRYLMVPTLQQGARRMSIRDFHNLIGRVGRSGMYTEGSIIFTDPEIWSGRYNRSLSWKMNRLSEYLEPENIEPCESTILSYFKQIKADDKVTEIDFNAIEFVINYMQHDNYFAIFIEQFTKIYKPSLISLSTLIKQLTWKVEIISNVQSFLTAQVDFSDSDSVNSQVERIASETFAYHTANEINKENIVKFFNVIIDYIIQFLPDEPKRKAYSKTLLSIKKTNEIENWILSYYEKIIDLTDTTILLKHLWPIINKNIANQCLRNCNKIDQLLESMTAWISGESYSKILQNLADSETGITTGSKTRDFDIDDVVNLCDSAFAYESTLILNAIIEMINYLYPKNSENIIIYLNDLQKQLKYGLPTGKSILIYELGFTDRHLSIKLSSLIKDLPLNKIEAHLMVIQYQNQINELLKNYPSYYNYIMDELLNINT